MQFTDIKLVILFPLAALLYFALPHKARKIWLLILNFLFIYSWGAFSLEIILVEVIVSYLAAIALEYFKSSHPVCGKAVMCAGTGVVLCYFLYCKYYNFALQTFDSAVGRTFVGRDIAVPIGISFYSLQILGYLIDVWRGRAQAEKNPLDYAVFITFFPLVLSGPIERSHGLLRQLRQPANTEYSYARVRAGLLDVIWGFFLKMVIADRASVIVSTVFDNYESYKGLPLIIASVTYAIQLYADFAGYSYTACGLAKILGFDIIVNFKEPYFAKTVGEFWKRWHISLSSWLKDYVYIPLGGSRCAKWRRYINLMATFLVSGLWHGAAWHFVVWGGLHALYQIAGDVLKPVANKINRLLNEDIGSFSYRFVRRLRTFILIDIAWVYFRASSCGQAWYMLKNSLYLGNFGMLFNGGIYTLGLEQRNMNILILGVAILLLHSALSERTKAPAITWLSGQGIVLRYMVYWTIITLIVISMNISSAEFLYMQF